MAIDDNYEPDSTQGNAVTTVFTGTWSPLAATNFVGELELISTGVRTPLVNGVDYSLTFTASGYVMTFLITAPTALQNAVRSREIPLTQGVTYTTSAGYQGEVLEASLDKLTGISQDLEDDISRAPKAVVGSTQVDVILGTLVDGEIIDFDLTSNTIQSSGVTTADLTTAVSDAAASAAAALVSENAAAADAILTAADVVTTNADVVLTNADVVTTNADVVLTAADVVSSAANAAAAQVAKIEWQGTYSGATAYALNDAVAYLGSSFINIQAGTGQTPVVGGTAYWDDLANKGDDGAGSGTVTSITAGTGLDGGTITTSGTIDLADDGVTTDKILNDAVTLAKMAGGTDGNLISYDTNGDPVAVATGTATHVLTSNGAGAAPTFQAAAGATSAANLTYELTSGTAGNALTAGSWQTVLLNTETDADSIVTLSSNQFTLGAGTYVVNGSYSFENSAGTNFRHRIRNTSDSTTPCQGTNGRADSSGGGVGGDDVTGVITIAGTKTFELQFYCSAAIGGVPALTTGDAEVYSRLTITKLK